MDHKMTLCLLASLAGLFTLCEAEDNMHNHMGMDESSTVETVTMAHGMNHTDHSMHNHSTHDMHMGGNSTDGHGHDMGGQDHDTGGHDGHDHDTGGSDGQDHKMGGSDHDMGGHDGHDHDTGGHDGHDHDMGGHDGHDTGGHDMGGHDMGGHDMGGQDTGGHGGHDMGGQDAGGHLGHGSSGHPLFFFLSERQIILFENWTTPNSGAYVGSCVGVAILAVFYEGLKIFREYLLQQARMRAEDNPKKSCTGYCCGMHFLQAFLHLVQTALSFGLMLVFMTYNVWLCVSVLIGAWLGYLLFAWTSHRNNVYPVSNFDHCM